MDEHKAIWKGKSGIDYPFIVYDAHVVFSPNLEGNYIFAKEIFSVWAAVYIGEGNLDTRTRDEIQRTYVLKKGATHIHVRYEHNDQYRKEIETDLLGFNTEAYEPLGCNKKLGK